MTVKEVESTLGITRANIRYYEKEGLIHPEIKENQYREYQEKEISDLKKIVIFRKMGISLEEIKQILNNQTSIAEVVERKAKSLEAEMQQLRGAYELCKEMKRGSEEIQTFNENYYWVQLQKKEASGLNFYNVLKDIGEFEIGLFDRTLRQLFLFDFEKSRKNNGWKKALGILIGALILRGIGGVLIWKQDFLTSALYPLTVFCFVSIILLPIYLLGKKNERLSKLILNIVSWTAFVFLIAIILLLLILVANYWFHFLF